MKSQTCIRRLRILSVFSIMCVCVLSRCSPLYSSTVPGVSLHCTHWTPSTVPFHRTPPLYPPHPSTVPTVPLHCTHPIVPFFEKITQPILHFCQPILHFCRPILHFCRPTFWVQWVGYSGRVQWCGTRGTMGRYKWYSATVQRVQWYSAEGTVVQCRGYSGTARRVRWYGIGLQVQTLGHKLNWVLD